MTLYFDCNATTPVDSRVIDAMIHVLQFEVGNAGSTHALGRRAKDMVHKARDQIGAVVNARRHEIIFTSGATEANNLAILGLAPFGVQNKRQHIVSSAIEHKAVLEPLSQLQKQGFEITFVPVDGSGRIDAEALLREVREDTLLVSLMHANNETGVLQPIAEVATGLADHQTYLHVDAAQGFGKEIEPLQHPRIDLISISGHKIYGPQGVGALVTRRRNFQLPPLQPLQWGGGQELGVRPGTLPVHLIVGLGVAAELALAEHEIRAQRCLEIRQQVLDHLLPLNVRLFGDQDFVQPHVVNFALPNWTADQILEAWDDEIAVSDGSACTMICDTVSHVLAAMGLKKEELESAIRLSWYHDSPVPDFAKLIAKLATAAPRS